MFKVMWDRALSAFLCVICVALDITGWIVFSSSRSKGGFFYLAGRGQNQPGCDGLRKGLGVAHDL